MGKQLRAACNKYSVLQSDPTGAVARLCILCVRDCAESYHCNGRGARLFVCVSQTQRVLRFSSCMPRFFEFRSFKEKWTRMSTIDKMGVL